MKEKKQNEYLQDIIGELEDDLLLETEQLRNGKSNKTGIYHWRKIGALVASISICFLIGVLWKNGLFANHTKDLAQNESVKNTQIESEQEKIQEELAKGEAQQNDTLDTPEGVNAKGTDEQSDGVSEEDKIREDLEQVQIGNSNSSVSNVYVPKKEVSLANADDTICDMIGFFIYQDRVYVEYTMLENATKLVGKKLGTAIGLIDEWTKQDGYVELAGSVKGDFYEVKDYESEFMLCMQLEDGDVWLFVNDNDLHLEKGANIFETYLHLSETSYEAFYMTNAVWNNETSYEEKKTAVQKTDYEKVEQLLVAMDEGEMILTEDIWKEYGIYTFYEKKQLYHLYLELEDGMLIHLRIFEGGYVMFDGVKDVCVKVEF